MIARLRVPAGFAAAIAYVALARPTPLAIAIGLPLVVLGLAIRLLASGHVVKSRELTTSGPYAHVRHPLYLGSAVMTLGFALAAADVALGAAILVLFLLVYGAVARREDGVLRERFGAAHAAYRAAVPAFFPRIRPWSEAAPGGGFSWERVRRHREHRAALGALALLVALVVRTLVG